MRPRLVFKASVGGEDNLPPWHWLKRDPGVIELGPWCEEQGITDYAYVEQVWVTEFGDGSLVAYFVKREILDEAEWQALRAEKGSQVSRVKVYPEDPKLSRTYIEHHPVTSIQLLLDQYEVPQEVSP